MYDSKIPENPHENLARMKSIKGTYERKLARAEQRMAKLQEGLEKATLRAVEFADDDMSQEAQVARRIVRKYEFDIEHQERYLRKCRGQMRWAERQILFIEEREIPLYDAGLEYVEQDEDEQPAAAAE